MFSAERFQEAANLGLKAEHMGLNSVTRAIIDAVNCDRAPATIKSYTTEMKKFQIWRNGQYMRTIPLPQARNLYLAKLSADGRQKLMPTVVAALNYFYGNLQGAPRELQSSLLETGRRVRLPTVTRAKIKPCEMNKLVILGIGNCDFKVLQAAALALIQFKALLRISEAANLLKTDVIQIDSNTWHLTVRRSKTDQHAKGAIVAFVLIPWSISYGPNT